MIAEHTDAFRTDTAEVTTAGHWAPPEAPLEMPRQRLEAEARRFEPRLLLRALFPQQRA